MRYPTELLNTLTVGSALPDHKRKLKKGFIVMRLRNLDPQNGHVNGARYVIENMTGSLLYLRVAVGSHEGTRLCLPRMPCGPGDDNFPVPGFTRTQFPIRTCFALTANKSQGQSFGGRIGLDLRDMCFSHGQLYVALSRTTHPSNVTVLTTQADSKTKNVVYPEVLSRDLIVDSLNKRHFSFIFLLPFALNIYILKLCKQNTYSCKTLHTVSEEIR